ncbi:MAG: integrase arm-type DNA-binding domain-containing protein [Sphingobium sp.]|uniref:tyrosine-type recombinase/integrase n=1 Tax=Sphingobium sp. TaxID=1912891 RepID=UPI0029B5D46A|nr:integrase arm-type DNA-binding domain-containing protein [Sphingobium sp.]MDX3908209.1 integrase arm-type DNA-binding domain-containing protein [Sphingobium sp.]
MRLYRRLSVKSIQAESRPGVHSDGDGLYMRVRDTGTKSWLYIGMLNRCRREIGLGSVRDVSLAQAREKARELRYAFRAGVDPVVEKKRAKAAERPIQTFGEFADALLNDIEDGFRNEKHRKQWRATLHTHAAELRAVPIDQIDAAAVLKVLQPIWLALPETASRVRGRIERVLDAAKAKGLRSGDNPARWKGHLELLLPRKPKGGPVHHAALPFVEISDFMEKLSARPASAARALEVTILTAARSGETLGMTWGELDWEAAIWTVPAERMKAGRSHEVPLSLATLRILKSIQPPNARATNTVFVGNKGQPLSNMAMSMLLRRMGYDATTVHGFRSTFRDWAGETTTFSREDVEVALAHTVASKTERAYRRGTALEKRREIMKAWASFCGKQESD